MPKLKRFIVEIGRWCYAIAVYFTIAVVFVVGYLFNRIFRR